MWVYCADEALCGANYKECWLKHLVRHLLLLLVVAAVVVVVQNHKARFRSS